MLLPPSLMKLARPRGGCFTLAEAELHGVSERQLHRARSHNVVRRVQRGVYALAGAPSSDLQQAWAAVLAVGAPSAVGGMMAARIHGLSLPKRLNGSPPEVVVPSQRVVRCRRDLQVRRLRLPWKQAVVAAHIDRKGRYLPSMLCAPWMVTELGRALGDWELARLVAEATAKRLATLDAIADSDAARCPYSGRPRVQRMLAGLRAELSHSREEQFARELLVQAGLPFTTQPHTVVGPDGRPLAEIDCAVPTIRFGVEVDGPHHLLPTQQQKDRARDRALGRLAEPWEISRWFADEIRRDPGGFVAEVRQLVARRRAHLGIAA